MCMFEKIVFTYIFNAACASIVIKDTELQSSPLSDQHMILGTDETHVKMLREKYLCPHFRILVMGRANAGKTTILEKVCGVAKGTKPIIYDNDGKSG